MANKNIFSIPLSQKKQASMRRRLIVFSIILFLLIFTLGTMSFLFFMEQIHFDYSGYELTKSVELERLKLEASVNAEIAIILKMADSPLIKQHFLNPDNSELERLVVDELGAYCRALSEQYVFWINDKDRVFKFTGRESFILDPELPENYWYNMTLFDTEEYNFNINYNAVLGLTNLWINAPVFDNNKKPIGMVGSGINLSRFISAIYLNYKDPAELYFFNSAGEITGSRNIELVSRKIRLDQELGQIGEKIMDRVETLLSDKIIFFHLRNPDRIIVLGAIPQFNWYVTAVHYFTIQDAMQTGMTVLFVVMIIVIFSIFAVFNIFIAKMLKPLNNIVKEIGRISSDWDLKHINDINNGNEIAALGEFLNMTIIDQLTGIYNRRFFDGSMRRIIKSLSRTGGSLSLLMIDIDFFKKYNDTYGHDAGDRCLREISSSFLTCITREEDFAARYGGEEFVVVLPNTDEYGASVIAEKLLRTVRDSGIPHESSSVAKYVTVSIGGTTGIVRYTQNESDYVKRADSALYKSKQNGRDQYTFEDFYRPQNTELPF